MKIAIQTLGCKVNQSESASIEGLLRNNNYEIVGHDENPDICIINTCTVTAKSDYQSRQLVRRAVRSGAKVIATGCYAQLKPGEFLKIKGLNLVVGNSAKDNILDHIRTVSGGGHPSSITDMPYSELKETPYHSTRARAFLKIQDGCNFSCSYCAVPKARGKSRSLNEKEVISSVEKLVSDGYREIVITGIHIGSYGLDLEPSNSLLNLISRLTDIFPDIFIRLSSIEPQEFRQEFIDLIRDKNVCPHLHIPLQSGSDSVLRKMNRGYSSSFYKHLIHRIITAYPDMSIGTDIIAGHPGESEKDFNDTVKFLHQLPLSYLHVFPYSRRPDTRSELLEGQVPEDLKKERVSKLLEISRMKKNSYMKRNLGRTLNAIIENRSAKSGVYTAISENYLRLYVEADSLVSGQSIRARVKSLTKDGLLSKPV